MLPFLLLSALWGIASCLEVTNTSSCTSTCDGPSNTFPSDLTCTDDAYWNTANGQTFRNCLDCESTSFADNGDTSTSQNNDIYWLLFNMKYTLQYCLFQENGTTPNLPQCESDCAGLYPVLTTSWFTTPPAKQYAYCSIDDDAFTANANTCASCLQSVTGSVVLGNFLDAMQTACNSQPDASLGETVKLQRDLFDTTTVGAVTTSTSSTLSSSTAATTSSSSTVSTFTAASTSSTPSATAPAVVSKSSSSGLSTGAAAGIGVACGLLAIAVVGGLAWFFLTRKRRAARNPATDNPHQDSKTAMSSATPLPSYAQETGGHQIHEIDSRQSRNMTNELQG